MSDEEDPIPVGSIWRERKTNRLIRVTGSSDVPAWVYINEKGDVVPHGFESANGATYNDWYTHRCDALDFVVWDRFERIS